MYDHKEPGAGRSQPSETFPSLLKEDCPKPNSFFPLLSIAPADTTDPIIINKVSAKRLGNRSLSPSFLSAVSSAKRNGGSHSASAELPSALLTSLCKKPHQKLARLQCFAPNDAKLVQVLGVHVGHH